MRVTVQRHTDHTVIQLRGELDALARARLLEEVEALAGSGPRLAVLNLHGVRFIDSTGLDAIIRSSSVLTAKGGKLAVSSPSSFCREVMERIGLDRILPILDTDDAARATLLPGSSSASSESVPGA